ncbi:uncharacterized protein N7487_001959 [Penicillium crustosum]|nr:uncharacterized protein N7487_001959 [Penicillium crustosum]KAJ5418409.1 hypothetical protein N7487_001959 [Penicillium crustosum]
MKSYSGCWTCRLRRKKCDEMRPECRICSSLQITCYYGHEKPAWMDGGAGQMAKAEEVKEEVKRAAARRRRGAQSMDALETNVAPAQAEGNATPFSDTEVDMLRLPSQPRDPASRMHVGGDPSSCSSPTHPSLAYTWSDGGSASISHFNASHNSAGTTPSYNGLGTLFADSSGGQASADEEIDRRFIVFYFDHFFPFLFPFYRPPLLEGGRSWVMELAVRNKAMWHTTLCLSSYFMSVALDNTASGHEFCKTLAWERLLRQTDVTFRMLQRDLEGVTSSAAQDLIIETSRIMGSVIQLLKFEVSAGNFENCQTHLDAAIVLFTQIFRAAGYDANDGNEDGESPTFHDILSQMGDPPWTMELQQRRAWNSDQAAFRFFSVLLLLDDIVTSTCLEEPPRLQNYHALLLSTNGSDGNASLSLETFVGCESWVILQVGQIAALDAWKKSLRKTGQLDTMELVARAVEIKQTLVENLASLDVAAHAPRTPNPVDMFMLYNNHALSTLGDSSTVVTRIWAHAALIYLSVVVSGWQPGSSTIRENVARAIELLSRLPAPALLRTVVWPFCIVGCLANPDEECLLRSMVQALAPLRLFGATQKALEIMENVWKRRDAIDVNTWDFAACVRTLGYVPLLV